MTLIPFHFDAAKRHCLSIAAEIDRFDLTLLSNPNWTLSAENDRILTPSSQRLLGRHPELFLFGDHCKVKRYPFGEDDDGFPVCECRQFQFDYLHSDFIWTINDLSYYFDIALNETLSAMFMRWRMMEKFQWINVGELYSRSLSTQSVSPWNLTDGMFHAQHLRVFELEDSGIQFIGEGIASWKKLAYFKSRNNRYLSSMPQSIATLSELGHFYFSESPKITQFPLQICALSKLRLIDVSITGIRHIPHCVAELEHLQHISCEGSAISSVPFALFNHPKFAELSAGRTFLSIEGLIADNNLTNFTEFDSLFGAFSRSFSKDYYFEEAPLCKQYNLGLIPSSSHFAAFLNATGCCEQNCDRIGLIDAALCTGWEYGNGVCSEDCNSARCHFDGGDCVQLCQCDPFLELGNGECNVSCNTTDCLFDGFDCFALNYDPIECDQTYDEHGCNASWLGDGWCDKKCQSSYQCGRDQIDCQFQIDAVCGDNVQCAAFWDIFSLIANSETNDNHIDLGEATAFYPIGLQIGISDLVRYQNVSHFMQSNDLDSDGKLSLDEAMIAFHESSGISVDKAQQIDCSQCLQ